MKTVASRLRWAREQAGLSQGQVAKMLGLHRPTISNIESGDRHVKAEEVNWFAETYGVDRDWILDGKVSSDEDGKVRMVARELGRLSQDDLDVILRIVQSLRKRDQK